ncbi:MAG TPA: type II toxin-antitoxin system HicA family toxin [Pseudonocardiaceae bacterium]|nr:type II toxin-antitoxin system HicA family toxin [Pseudonocardiaceae bacterium]
MAPAGLASIGATGGMTGRSTVSSVPPTEQVAVTGAGSVRSVSNLRRWARLAAVCAHVLSVAVDNLRPVPALGHRSRDHAEGSGGRADMPLTVHQMIKLIEEDGWTLARVRGSHRHYTHTTKPGVVTVPGKLSRDLPIGTERSILKQARINRRPR